MGCEHQDFVAVVDVNRIQASSDQPMEHLTCYVRVECAACHEPMVFHGEGLPVGLLWDRPTISAAGTELHVPCRPQSEDPNWGRGAPGFVVRAGEGFPPPRTDN